MNYPIPASTPPSSLFASRVAVVALLLLVILPIVFFGRYGEIDRWRAAHAMEAWLDGDREASIQTLTKITERLPNDHRLKLVLGEWLLEEYQAEKALELGESIPVQFQGPRSESLVQNSLISLGKRKEALEAYRKANPAEKSRGYLENLYHRNALAYFQALAEVDLDLALKNSDFVIDEVAYAWNREQGIPLSAHLQGLFCTAYIYHEVMLEWTGDESQRAAFGEKAIAILSGAIAHLEEEVSQTDQRAPEDGANSQVTSGADGSTNESSDLNEVGQDEAGQGSALSESNRLKSLSETLQLLLTLRALVYQNLGEKESSYTDRKQVVELGGDPELIADAFPSMEAFMFQLSQVSMILDTRGCVLYARNDIPGALSDLNIAVMGQEALVDAAFLTPRNGRETSLDPRQQFEEFVKAPQRTLAALLFHRSWARRSVGDTEGASDDLTKIRELGYVPGNYLF